MFVYMFVRVVLTEDLGELGENLPVELICIRVLT